MLRQMWFRIVGLSILAVCSALNAGFDDDLASSPPLRLESFAQGNAINPRFFDKSAVQKSFKLAKQQILDSRIVETQSDTDAAGSGLLCGGFFDSEDSQSTRLADFALTQVLASKNLIGSRSDKSSAIAQLAFVDVSNLTSIEECPKLAKISCPPSRYRSLDGLCNNVAQPWMGVTNEPFLRHAAARYEDGLNEPRMLGDSGDLLPNARFVSAMLFRRSSDNLTATEETQISYMVPLYAHFVLSDVAEFAVAKRSDGKCIACCDMSEASMDCLPISVKVDDSVFGETGCLSYSRLLPAVSRNCGFGKREVANLATSFMDGSQIYGNSMLDALRLRSMKDGKLRTQKSGKVEVPLVSKNVGDRCRSTSSKRPCFEFGNFAGNLNAGTAALNFVWISEHNRVAKRLKEINAHWQDEQLFQETRRIVVAEMQHIAYNEFLPLVVGVQGSWRWGLYSNTSGYFGAYNMSVNPATSLAVAFAAGQFYQSMWLDEDLSELGVGLQLSDGIYNPEFLHTPGALTHLMGKSALNLNPLSVSYSISRELTDKFFKRTAGNVRSAHDLMAILVQMGRDVGMETYLDARRACGLEDANSFDDLAPFVFNDSLPLLQLAYESVEDIDLIAGGLAEIHDHGALVGPTFSCLITAQFQRLKVGDRYWYENYVFPSAFTEERLVEIRKASLARILCDNTKIGKVQPAVFLASDNFDNFPVSCNGTVIQQLNLEAWHDAEPKASLPITQATIRKAISLGQSVVKQNLAAEKSKLKQNPAGIATHSCAAFQHSRIMRTSPIALALSQSKSEVLLETTRAFMNRVGFDPADIPEDLDGGFLQQVLPDLDVSTVLDSQESSCLLRNLPCDYTAKYRTIDGWCNNLNFPEQGAAFTVFRRLMAPVYADGFNDPRNASVTGNALNGPRAISNVVHQTDIVFQQKFSLLLMQWGQFLDHDLTLTPVSTSANGSALACSACDSNKTVSCNCLPILIPVDDPFFPANSSNGAPVCMSFVRSLVGNVKLGYRQQLNQITSYIDASNVYGSDECTAKKLRDTKAGRLLGQQIDGRHEYLPANPTQFDCRFDRKHECFMAGDQRVNVQVGLQSFHTIWLREHNRIAEALSVINPTWSDERLYQETRRIVAALHQQITFREWLPRIVGNSMMDRFNLLPATQGYFAGYNEFCDASIANEFATASYRFGHSLVWAQFFVYSGWNEPMHMITMEDSFNQPDSIYESNGTIIDEVMRGMAAQPPLAYDRFIDPVLRDRLFENPDVPFSGLDLAALNIQRGRDHGLASYTRYREWAQLTPSPKTFDDLVTMNIMENDTVDALRTVYESVEDIDLWTGIISETPIKGAVTGPLAAQMIAEQFSRLRKCDRFWYENGDYPGTFTSTQLAEIRKYTFAKILCRHSENLTTIPPNIFAQPNELQNWPIACSELPDMDLSAWLEKDECEVQGLRLARGASKIVTPCVSCTCTTEGPICQSFRVSNCPRLIAKHGASTVAADRACLVQCNAFLGAAVKSHLQLPK